MALILTVYCSNHQTSGEPKEIELSVGRIASLNPESIKRMIEEHPGWVVQFNGEHVDTYCSKKCAK